MNTKQKMWIVRVMMIAVLPFVLALAFFSQLLSGIRSAFYYAWLEVRIEIDSFKKVWALYDGSKRLSEEIAKWR